MVRSLVFCITVFTSTMSWAAKDVLFEGFYKISSGDQHIGYSIVRYEFDGKKFYSTYINKLSSNGSEVIESLSATAEADKFMTPVSYKFTSLVSSGKTKEAKSIDAKFTKGKTEKDKIKMTAEVIEQGKKPVTIRNDLNYDVFLSTFLSYRMLKSEQGIQTNSKFNYTAVAEEDGAIKNGTAETVVKEKYKGFDSFKIKNTFKDTLFTSYVTDKGEALATIVTDARLTSELVPTAGEAIGNIGLPETVAKNLFGNVPTGINNTVSRYFKESDKLKAPTNGGKQEGFPAGQGVQIKADPTKKEGP